MCGIVGCLGPLDMRLLNDMLAVIRHRGPDDEAIFLDDRVALGVRRLAIVDAEHGRQPLCNEKETVWGALNGEIYNFLEIKNELTRLGHTFHTNTDTETLVHAYEEWDFKCLQKLKGMFAFAIWDKDKQRLFLARDRLGIKPFYYCHRPNNLVFASEIKALLADKTIPRIPNDDMIVNFLITGHQEHTGETFFIGIKELLPGHYMFVDQEQMTTGKYWELAAFHPGEAKADEYYLSKFHELLLDAIKIRIPSNLVVGSYLSGGLDSTAIVCLTNEVLKSPSLFRSLKPKTQEIFSAFYSEAGANESPFIEEVGRCVKTKVNCVFPSSEISWTDIKKFVYYMDEPVTVLNYYTYWCLARTTKGHVKVTFSGQGPDEFLAGHPDHFLVYLKELWKTRQIARLVLELLSSLNRYGLFSILRQMRMTFTSRSVHAERLLDTRHVERQHRRLERTKIDSLYQALFVDVTQNRLPMHLRVGDRVTSAFSIESRFPYLDHRIIEFAFSLPANLKIRNGWSKYVLRNVTRGIVPESVRRRKKLGTPIPLERWIEDLYPKIVSAFGSSKFHQRGYFNQSAVLNICNRYHEKKLNSLERQIYADMLWRILNVELWFESFFDQQDVLQDDD
jgi:asparagine synthase (glutamine-hydrolysing)